MAGKSCFVFGLCILIRRSSGLRGNSCFEIYYSQVWTPSPCNGHSKCYIVLPRYDQLFNIMGGTEHAR